MVQVYIDDVPAKEIIFQNGTLVRFRLGRGTAKVGASVKVESDDGSMAKKLAAFKKLADGEITAILPRAAAAGVSVTSTGTELFGHATAVLGFTVAGVVMNLTDPTEVMKVDASEFVFVVPANQTGQGEVEILGSDGAVVDTNVSTLDFQYAVINTLTPDSGQQGTLVTITGAGLDSGDGAITAVNISGNPATLISGHSADNFFDSIVVEAGRSCYRQCDSGFLGRGFAHSCHARARPHAHK